MEVELKLCHTANNRAPEKRLVLRMGQLSVCVVCLAHPRAIDDEDAPHERDVLPDLRLTRHGRHLAHLCWEEQSVGWIAVFVFPRGGGTRSDD